MIRAIIADDSPFLREVLQEVLERSRKIEVIGAARNGKEAIELVKVGKPDILILDCEMPVMNGLEALRRIMEECPLPVFIFSSLANEGGSVTIKALEYGAVDFFLKPTKGAQELEAIADDLVRKIEMVCLKSRFSQSLDRKKVVSSPARPVVPVNPVTSRRIDLIAMGSSTGGVQAAMQIIPKLPPTTKPIVWVQHMPPNFTRSFAERLNSVSQMRVKEAADGDTLVTGTCFLAPGGFQMRIKKNGVQTKIVLGEQEKIGGFCPACNVLFDSVVEYYANNVIGVILTGMGEDGKEGLVKMHAKGAYVIGQNEASCVVYGMPKAAQKAGAVDIEVDIDDVANTIVRAGGAKP